MAQHERKPVGEAVDVEAGGGGGRQRAAAAAGERMRLTWSCLAVAAGVAATGVAGAAVLVWWAVAFHPAHEQLWMVPVGLVLLGTPLVAWLSLFASGACRRLGSLRAVQDQDSGGNVRSGPDSTRILHASCMQKPPCELRVPTYGYLWAPNGKPAKPLLCFEFRRRRHCGSGALTLTIAVAIQLDYITGGGMACPGTVPFGGASTRKAAVR
uniref:Uncharacterized protein n=1 Tax=Oryza glumipatula TaxID=40148 RepID=A0A0D9Z1J0_9ORYZ